jgi:cytochrome c oxidase subunit 2
MERFLGLPEVASEHGARLDFTLGLVHVLMLALFAGWAIYFVFVLARFRRSRNPRASYAGAEGKASKWIEGAVIVAEAVLLIGFSFPLWAERVEAFPPAGEATVVRVVGEQFAWNVHYPGPDGKFGRTDPGLIDLEANPLGLDREDPAAKDDITTVNQLHLPVNRPAIVHLSSKDVIHSFALQEMRIKQDAVPGLSIPVWFVPTVTTEEMRRRKGNPQYNYEISCAQLCGLGHYRMRGFLTVDTPESWRAWLDEQAALLSSSEEGGFWE